MRRLSLQWKFLIIGLVPLCLFLTLSFHLFLGKLKIYRSAEINSAELEVVKAASELVHQAQIERGKTAGFLGGSVAMSELEGQWKKTDAKVERLGVALSGKRVPDFLAPLQQPLAKFAALRKDVQAKDTPAAELVKRYSEIIGNLLSAETEVAKRNKNEEIGVPLFSMAVLEEAKENCGKLRANLTGVLSQNSAIDEAKVSLLVNVKAKVDANLASPALDLPPEILSSVKAIDTSPEWVEVNRVFQLVLAQAKQGGFNIDPKRFFHTISATMDQLAQAVAAQEQNVGTITDSAETSARNTMIMFLTLQILATIGLTWWAVSTARATSRNLAQIADRLNAGSDEVAQASAAVSASGTELSAAATEQAAALQETVASVDEISAMVNKNAEAATRSTELAGRSREVSETGKNKVNEMISSIREIAASNQVLANEMKESNREIAELVKVISEIGDKTKVINDIVFQTKLLSFNASVEAARAGEHGKGFAVVAEEVGNLAQMSGNAAKEISQMLASSTARVEEVVRTTGEKIERLVSSGQQKVDAGTEIAQRCGESLDQILDNAASVGEIVSEISTASQEQAKGISEVTKAMSQLDQVTQQNTAVSQQSATSANQLSVQAAELRRTVIELRSVITGNAKQLAVQEETPELSNLVQLPESRRAA